MNAMDPIDDDITEFINQIANSNESDSPINSTNSTSETNSLKQVEPLEVIEQKTVLPPCQVCGGNSSGYVIYYSFKRTTKLLFVSFFFSKFYCIRLIT